MRSLWDNCCSSEKGEESRIRMTRGGAVLIELCHRHCRAESRKEPGRFSQKRAMAFLARGDSLSGCWCDGLHPWLSGSDARLKTCLGVDWTRACLRGCPKHVESAVLLNVLCFTRPVGKNLRFKLSPKSVRLQTESSTIKGREPDLSRSCVFTASSMGV